MLLFMLLHQVPCSYVIINALLHAVTKEQNYNI